LARLPSDDDLATQIHEDYHWADDYRRARFPDWNRYYQLYCNYVDKSQYPFTSNLSIPTATTIIEVQVAAILSYIFEQGKLLIVNGRTERAQVGAGSVEALLHYHFAHSFNTYEDLELFVRQFLLNGTSIYKVLWEYEEGEHEVEIADYSNTAYPEVKKMKVPFVAKNRPNGYVVSSYNFGVDPAARDMPNARYAFEDLYMDPLTLVSLANAGIVPKKNLRKITLEQSEIDQPLAELYNLVGFEDFQVNYSPGRNKLHLIDYYGHVGYNEYKPLRSKRQLIHCIAEIGQSNMPTILLKELMPYDHNKIPFIVARRNPKVNEFYGTSDLEDIESLLLEERDMRNMYLDNLNRMVNRMFKVRADALPDEAEVFWRPSGIIHFNEADDIDVLDPGVMDPSYEKAMNTLRADIEAASGVNDFVTGQFRSSSGFNDTATGISLIQEAALQRVGKKANTIQRSIKEIGEMTFGLLGQYADYDQIIRVTDHNEAQGYRFVNLDADSLRNMYDFDVVNAPTLGSKPMRQQNLMQLLQLAITAKQYDPQIPFDFYRFFVRVMKEMEIPNPQEFLGFPQLNMMPLLPEGKNAMKPTMDPNEENTLMVEQGQTIQPKLNEDHVYHRVVHQEAYHKVEDPDSKARLAEHDTAHVELMQISSQITQQQMRVQANQQAVAGAAEEVYQQTGTNAKGGGAFRERDMKQMGDVLGGQAI